MRGHMDAAEYKHVVLGLIFLKYTKVARWEHLQFLARSKKNGKVRDRRGQTLFIDARKMGALVDRTHRDLMDDDIQ
jgi:type I restriction-modification system DNA methylase subunit